MEKIKSFKVNHLVLEPGLYVSRKDAKDNQIVTTFDLRFIRPNREDVMNTGVMHTIEHLGATYLRNSNISDDVIYFGPMGCRTGFYLVLFGDLDSEDVYEIVCQMCDFIIDFEGDIPGAKPEECGNYSDQDLPSAKASVKTYLKDLLNYRNFNYC